jgi:hypothetical protein
MQRSIFLSAAATLALVAVAACATSPEPDLSPLEQLQDGGGATTLPSETSDAGSTPPPKQPTTGTDAGAKDAGTSSGLDAGKDSGPPAPGACDTSDPFNAFIYSIEASGQDQPVPCPCADPSTQCCYQGQTCVDI